MPTPCFWVEENGKCAAYLRRYTAKHAGGWTCEEGWHEARVFVGIFTEGRTADGMRRGISERRFRGDPRWPKKCDSCSYRFNARRGDVRQVWTDHIYVRPDTGETWRARELPAGALYDSWWVSEHYQGPDGLHLTAICPNPVKPGGVFDAWIIDGPSSNGGRWTREGDPHNPQTLSMNPSIAKGKPESPDYYHGWLHNGVFSDHIG